MNNFKNVLYLKKKGDKAYIPGLHSKVVQAGYRAFQVEKVSQGKNLMARISKGNYTSRETLAHLKESEALLEGGFRPSFDS
jgi:lipopolysaccharide export system protein LptA